MPYAQFAREDGGVARQKGQQNVCPFFSSLLTKRSIFKEQLKERRKGGGNPPKKHSQIGDAQKKFVANIFFLRRRRRLQLNAGTDSFFPFHALFFAGIHIGRFEINLSFQRQEDAIAAAAATGINGFGDATVSAVARNKVANFAEKTHTALSHIFSKQRSPSTIYNNNLVHFSSIFPVFHAEKNRAPCVFSLCARFMTDASRAYERALLYAQVRINVCTHLLPPHDLTLLLSRILFPFFRKKKDPRIFSALCGKRRVGFR